MSMDQGGGGMHQIANWQEEVLVAAEAFGSGGMGTHYQDRGPRQLIDAGYLGV